MVLHLLVLAVGLETNHTTSQDFNLPYTITFYSVNSFFFFLSFLKYNLKLFCTSTIY